MSNPNYSPISKDDDSYGSSHAAREFRSCNFSTNMRDIVPKNGKVGEDSEVSSADVPAQQQQQQVQPPSTPLRDLPSNAPHPSLAHTPAAAAGGGLPGFSSLMTPGPSACMIQSVQYHQQQQQQQQHQQQHHHQQQQQHQHYVPQPNVPGQQRSLFSQVLAGGPAGPGVGLHNVAQAGGVGTAAASAAAAAPTPDNMAQPPAKEKAAAGAPSQTKNSRFPWLPQHSILMCRQVLATGLHTAAHGKKGEGFATLAATLNTVGEFTKYGPVKADACSRKLQQLLATHKAEQENGEYESGKRTGQNEELYQALCDIVQDTEEAAAKKGEGDAAAAAEEVRKNIRAEKTLAEATKQSGSGKRKARSGAGGAAGTASAPIAVDMVEFLKSKTDSPGTKEKKLRMDMMNAETKHKEAETAALQSATAAQQSAMMISMAAKMMEFVKDHLGQDGKTPEDSIEL